MNEYYGGENLSNSSCHVKILVRVRNQKEEKESRGGLNTEESVRSGTKSNLQTLSKGSKVIGGRYNSKRDGSSNKSKSPGKSSKQW